MPSRQRSGIFLSYARKDGETFAAQFRDRLSREASDITIKQDRLSLEGGVGWWTQITDAIDSVEFLVLVMTPWAMESETVRKEWQYARQQGVCVYPVKAASDSELQFSKLPRWMRKAHFFDVDKEWNTFVQHLRSPCHARRVAFMAPDMPETFIRRPAQFNQLKSFLLASDRNEPVAITTALSGAGGFGKTTLATALCHDEEVVRNFDDGVLWVTLGQQPDVLGALLTLYSAVTGERPGFANEEDASFQLGNKLEDKTCLLVVDDVWDAKHLRPFLRGGKQCARLFTTRDFEIAAEAKRVPVDEMTIEESIALVTAGVPDLDREQARTLSGRLGEWPLALELARATLRQKVEMGDTPEKAMSYVTRALAKKGLGAITKQTAEERHRTIDSTLQASFGLLSEKNQQRLTELSIFPEDVAIPLPAASLLWDLDEFDTEETTQRFHTLSLLRLDLRSGTIRVHDVMRAWLKDRVPNAEVLHGRLLHGWGNWSELPDLYAWQWLTWHVAQAGRKDDLRRILFDPEWLKAKLDATEVNSLITDFEQLKSDPEGELVQGALRLSAHILATDKSQLFSQLRGRLLLFHMPHLEAILAIEHAPQLWLRPMTASLTPPGGGLLRTLSGHARSVNAVGVFAEGKRALSGSHDRTLKLWDLETGAELRTLSGHAGSVNVVAVFADGKRALSASRDHTLTLWDLETGAELHTLSGHTEAVNAVGVFAEGKRALSGSHDHTLKLWDLETGAELRTLSGHAAWVNAVAVFADGKRALSASYDHTLKLWDLETGAELRTLSGHTGAVNAVAVFGEDQRALFASSTLKLWDLETGAELRTLSGHTGAVNAVAVFADGTRALSASDDGTLKLWDLGMGAELRILSDHAHSVNAVAVFAGGMRALSASDDHTLKLWDLETGAELRILSGHTGAVKAVAVFGEGKRALSASSTLKLWDLETGAELRTLSGHTGAVNAVAVFGEDQRALSASDDHTLKLWDLETGAELRTLSGHASFVNAVAVFVEGQRALSASSDHTLKLWNLESGTELRTLSGHAEPVNAVAVFAEGKRALSASSDNTLKLWDLETGTKLLTLSGHVHWVTAVAVFAEGKRALSGSLDGTLKLWDLESGAELRTLTGHTSSVRAVAVFADGRRALSASEDHTLKLWNLETRDILASFTADAGFTTCAVARDETLAIGGDRLGRIHFLKIVSPARKD